MSFASAKTIKDQSIIRRLFASLLATVLVVSAIAVTAMNHVVSQDATRDLAQKADETLAYLVGTLGTSLWSLDDRAVRSIGAAVANDESILRLVIRNDSGTVIYSMAKDQNGEGGDIAERSGRVYYKQGNQNELAGDVSVSMTHAQLKAGTQKLLFLLTLIIFFILVSAVLVTVFVIRASLSKPLHHLDEIASLFASGKYDTSAHTLPYAEFQPFSRAMAQMAKTIEEKISTVKVAEAKYRDIFENAMEGIFRTSVEGQFLNTNPAFVRILGYASQDDLSASARDSSAALYVDSRARDRLLEQLGQRAAVAGFETRFRRKDAQVIWVSISARLVRNEAGEPSFIEGFLIDISDRKQAEEEIRTLNRELERRVAQRTAELQAANRELETFSYSVSHDLRTPLRHIDGFLGLLMNRIGATLDAESRRYMATISSAALRMAALIDDLLSFSRSGRFEMLKTQVDLGDLVEEVIREFEPDTQERSINWQLGLLPVVSADRAMLRVVLVNLISNALKFTQPRTQAEIEIGCLLDHETETIVFVRDNGVGFDMQYAGKLFGVFERLHGVDEFKGTGIGLANVRRVVSRHGGRTWAEGKVQGGATFYFSLPHVAAESPSAGA